MKKKGVTCDVIRSLKHEKNFFGKNFFAVYQIFFKNFSIPYIRNALNILKIALHTQKMEESIFEKKYQDGFQGKTNFPPKIIHFAFFGIGLS